MNFATVRSDITATTRPVGERGRFVPISISSGLVPEKADSRPSHRPLATPDE